MPPCPCDKSRASHAYSSVVWSSTEVSIVPGWQPGLTCGPRRWGLGSDSETIHGLCPGFLLPPIVDLGLGEGRSRVVACAIVSEPRWGTLLLNRKNASGQQILATLGLLSSSPSPFSPAPCCVSCSAGTCPCPVSPTLKSGVALLFVDPPDMIPPVLSSSHAVPGTPLGQPYPWGKGLV